jgi:phage baseplate assembly protein W
MENKIDQSFLGVGWGFPPTFSSRNLVVETVTELEDIKQSLYVLISTTPGERLMNPAYGCDLQRLVFERINDALFSEIKSMVSYAIYMFEPRVTVDEIVVQVESYEEGIIRILVEFTVIQTNSRSNVVFPYYLLEGTNVFV